MTLSRCFHCDAENDHQLGLCFKCGRSLSEVGPGAVIADRFELLVEVGRGGMGWVFRAHDRMLDEEVAVKVLLPESLEQQHGARRFRKEVRLARRVAHPNVCRIFDYGETDHLHFIAMEFIDGVDLKHALALRKRGLPIEDAFAATSGVAAALQAIHDAGIIHRDLKSQNVMVDARGVVRVTDLGIAKETRKPRKSLTGPDAVMGTPEYMSPEQCRGEPLDVRSDVYSLGILCHELFTGDVPHRGSSAVDTVMLQLNQEPDYERAISRGLPESLVGLLRQTLKKDRSERIASAIEFAEALDPVRDAVGVPRSGRVRSIDSKERRRDRRLEIPVGCWIRVMESGEQVPAEELTIAENISSGGARVKTSLEHLAVGDQLLFEEIGGPFRSRTEVRGVGTFDDGVRRLHLKFVEHSAPAHLVGGP